MDLTQELIQSWKSIPWFSNSGKPNDQFHLVRDAVEPFDNPDYQSYELWSDQTHKAEQKALQSLSESEIDTLFFKITSEFSEDVKRGLDAYFSNRVPTTENMKTNADLGLWQEILDTVLRDLAWVLIENEFRLPGFFTELLKIYRLGYWPCGWIGNYPKGRYAVL
ncbi:hypothetical protein ACFLRB_00015 [Acidobacteriota bacterium]